MDRGHAVPLLLFWGLPSLVFLWVVRKRRSEILRKKPVFALSPRAKDISADNIVAIEKSDKGALIDHPRRLKVAKNDFVGFGTMQRKLMLVLVGESCTLSSHVASQPHTVMIHLYQPCRYVTICSWSPGLPARGKSYIAKMLIRYLTWTGISAQIFNVGELRRKLVRVNPMKPFVCRC